MSILWFKFMIVNPILNEIELIIYLLLIVIADMTGKCPPADRACQAIKAATWNETCPWGEKKKTEDLLISITIHQLSFNASTNGGFMQTCTAE